MVVQSNEYLRSGKNGNLLANSVVGKTSSVSAINLGLFRHFSANIPPSFPSFWHHWFVIHAVGGRQELWKNVPGTKLKLPKVNLNNHGQKGSTFMDFSQFSENIFQPPKTKTNLSCDSCLFKKKDSRNHEQIFLHVLSAVSWICFIGTFFQGQNCFNGGALGEQWSVARRQILHLSRETSSRYTP